MEVLAVIFAYFLGNVSPGLLLSQFLGRGDVRAQGSGATGATNAARALGKKWFGVVLALDMLKGAMAAGLPWLFSQLQAEEVPAEKMLVRAVACGLSVVAGHVWPALLGFRGGKGVGPFFGVWLALGLVAWPAYWFAPFTLLAAIVCAVPFLALKKGGLLAALCALPAQAGVFWCLTGNTAVALPAFAMVFILMFTHSENFRRKRGSKANPT